MIYISFGVMSEKKSKSKESTSEVKKADLLDDVTVSSSTTSLKDFSKTSPFSFNKENYKLLLIGLGINIIGYLLMIGGANEDPNTFDASEMFSTTRITIAPMLIIAGFGIIIYSIMKKPKAS